MARRRSARLASSSSCKPAKPTPALSSLTEGNESPPEGAMPSLDEIVSSPVPAPKTPGQSSPIKPPLSEMHPSKVHPTMAPPSSGLRLGFTDIKPTAGRPANVPGAAQSTPTKIGIRVPSSSFTFRFARQAAESTNLGPEAQKMMDELREDAKKIKAELLAQREAEKLAEEQASSRKIAQPKGRAGRYSAAHMAEFKKMDSIANHPSAYRAQPGRFTPKTGLKRTQSKANLDDSETLGSKAPTPVAKPSIKSNDAPESPVKRARQRLEDDASSSRPISRDGSFIPRPKSSGRDNLGVHRSQSVASLMTPTKASIARAAAAKTPAGSVIKSPATQRMMLSGLKRSATTKSTTATGLSRIVSPNVTIRSPSGRFAKFKSFLHGDKTGSDKPKSSIPQPSGITTPFGLDKPLPSLPVGSAGPSPTKHVVFTPETKRVLTTQTTPSPIKSGIPRSKSRQVLGEVHYPTLDTVMTGDDALEVAYPDLSARRPLPEPPVKVTKKDSTAPGVPGEFSFRSDYTISFASASPKGFGLTPGQSSVRQVRPSILPTVDMPGSFPSSTVLSSSPDKENEAPVQPPVAPLTVFKTVPHGMINKKRHRVTSDEEEAEQEAAERAAKKRRNEVVPEGEALLAPRLIASAKKPMLSPMRRFGTPSSVGTPSPKKKSGLSLSRLNMLARPKNRK